MSEAEQEKRTHQQVALRLDWHIPEHIKSQYADNILVQSRRHDVIISFFESQVPPFGGTPEENRALLEKLDSIRAECVGRIVVAVDLLPEIIKALQMAYDEYLSTREERADA